MGKILYLVSIIIFPVLGNAQDLAALVTSDIIDDPGKAILWLGRQKPVTESEVAKNYYILGKCFAYLNREDIALSYFIKAKKSFEKGHNTGLAKDVALEAYLVVSSQENFKKYGTRFLEEYYEYAIYTRSALRMAYSFNEFGKNATDRFDYETGSNPYVLDSAQKIYVGGLQFAIKSRDRGIRAILYSNIGNLLNAKRKFDSARFYFREAEKYRDGKNEFDRFADVYNIGNSYYNEGAYKEALAYFLKAEGVRIPYYRDKAKRGLYRRIEQTADMLGEHKVRRKYRARFDSINATINEAAQNEIIHNANIRYQVEEKDRKISLLENAKMKFEHNKIIYSILLFLVFLLALYSYVRWKKVDRRRKNLEREKNDIEIERTQAVEQLEKVRQLVIKNKIVLKNKSTVSLDNLMYIQVEDHYLHLVLNEGKKEFLRGKLAEILDQLPPNFRKCHRSYIVNTNYIKSLNSRGIVLANKEVIPVSRDFKL